MVVFIAGVATTAYFCRSMGDEMRMPGGWNMSMMWMQMPAVAIVIAAEKLLPRPEIIARLVGSAAIVAGVITSVLWFYKL